MPCRGRSGARTGSPGTCSPGFTNMLLRLWEAEQPRAVVVGWDTLFVPTYRHELLPGYQAGREFDPELLEQLDLAPGPPRGGGGRLRQGGGIRGGRLPRRRGRRRASSRRNLARRDLRPRRLPARRGRRHDPPARPRCQRDRAHRARRGPRALRRRARAGPGFHRSARRSVRQDPRRPRRRREDRGLASLAVRNTRRAARGRSVRGGGGGAARISTYRHLRRRGAAAAASQARPRLGRRRGRRRRPRARAPRGQDAGGRIDLISHPALGRLHPTSRHHHPEREERLALLLESVGPARTGRAATREQVERVHQPEYLDMLAGLTEEGWLDGDSIAGPTTLEAALLAAGCALEAAETRSLRARPSAGPPRAARSSDGVLLRRERRRCGAPCTGRARLRTGRDRRLGRSPRERDRGDLPTATTRFCSCRSTSGRSIPAREARERATRPRSTSRSQLGQETRSTSPRSPSSSSLPSAGSTQTSFSSRRASTPTWTIHSLTWS